jgi:hypothetical protein
MLLMQDLAVWYEVNVSRNVCRLIVGVGIDFATSADVFAP